MMAEHDAVPYTFSSVEPRAGERVPAILDLVGAELDPIDRAAVDAAPDAIAVWRAWRSAPEQPAVRVYLIETAQPVAAVIRALRAAGLDDPQVEAYAPGTDLTSYQSMARGSSALLHAAGDRPPVRLARVFDRGGARPSFDDEHERLGDDERDRVRGYLRAGEPILVTTRTSVDVLEPDRGPVVPLSFRTDGQWVWTDTVEYYLREYSLAPDAELLAHIRSRGYATAPVDAAGEHRTLATLLTRA